MGWPLRFSLLLESGSYGDSLGKNLVRLAGPGRLDWFELYADVEDRDIYGRKPVILMGLCCTMFTSILWGFSTNLPMAIVARGIAGAGNGNVGIIRTT